MIVQSASLTKAPGHPANFIHVLSNQIKEPTAKMTARKVMIPSRAWEINNFASFISYYPLK